TVSLLSFRSFFILHPSTPPTLFPYTTLFRSYSFCMCPGGEVVAAASEEGGVVTNGMSRYARDGRNANAAIAVSVFPEDIGGGWRSEEHTSELQSRFDLVCRLLLEKKKNTENS